MDDGRDGREEGPQGGGVVTLRRVALVRGRPEGAPRMEAEDPAAPAMASEEVMRVELETLRLRHRDLDAAIAALAEKATDPFAVRRLKKRKLMLRDRIAYLEDQLTPDIIA